MGRCTRVPISLRVHGITCVLDGVPYPQPGDNFWGDSYLPQIKDMLEQLCAHRTVSDCEFFINKRDYPHMKVRAGAVAAVQYLVAVF
jgi:hypothetical protein